MKDLLCEWKRFINESVVTVDFDDTLKFKDSHTANPIIVNKIKRREWFRPFAGTVLLEHAKDWFEMGTIKESPYMSYAIPVKEDKKNYSLHYSC